MSGRFLSRISAFTLVMLLGLGPQLGAQVAASPASKPGWKISRGKIRVLDLLRFVQVATGKMVICPSTPATVGLTTAWIDVLEDVDPLTYTMINALLEANGFLLIEERLGDGSHVILVRHRKAPLDRTRVTPILTEEDLRRKEQPKKQPSELLPPPVGFQSVPILKLLRQLQEVAGLMVIYPSRESPAATGERVFLLGDLKGCSSRVLQGVLDGAGYRVAHEFLMGGLEAFTVFLRQKEPLQGPQAPSCILVSSLKHISVTEALQQLRDGLKDKSVVKAAGFRLWEFADEKTLIFEGPPQTLLRLRSLLQEADAAK